MFHVFLVYEGENGEKLGEQDSFSECKGGFSKNTSHEDTPQKNVEHWNSYYIYI
jgi:hypothetical protein